MNSIPLMLDDCKTTYTVIGGGFENSEKKLPVSVLIMNRGPMLYRESLVQELVKAGFDSILSVESGTDSPELEGLSGKYRQVRFVCIKDNVNFGTRLNIGIRESSAPFVLVIWNDMHLEANALSSFFLTTIPESNAICIVPELLDCSKSIIPSISIPAQSGKSLQLVFTEPEKENQKSLYPYDLCGIYSREKFILLGGFDWTMDNPYWQEADFGTRAWLWGEKIIHSKSLKMEYSGDSYINDITVDKDYNRFWLKNIAPVYRGDCCLLPTSKIFTYLINSGCPFSSAKEDFREAKEWVKACEFRFKQDAMNLASIWEVPV